MGYAADAALRLQKLLAQRYEARCSGSLGLMHVVENLRSALINSQTKRRQLCLLVDTAQAEKSHLKLNRWRIPYISLFDHTPEESLLEIAPLLVPTGQLNTQQLDTLFEWAQELAFGAPCISWFETDADVNKIAEHFRLFHIVGLTEGQTMLMRWYDTRILPVWLACLTLQQANAFAAGTRAWQYVDRTGAVVSLPVDERDRAFPGAPPFGQPLVTLTDAQYGLLVDAADLDILLNHLRRIIPDELRRVPSHRLSMFVSHYQQKAISAGLTDIDRQTQYVLLALYTSGKGVEHPKFKAFLKTPSKDLNKFVEEMQALPDDVWNAGHPLWTDSTASNAFAGPESGLETPYA